MAPHQAGLPLMRAGNGEEEGMGFTVGSSVFGFCQLTACVAVGKSLSLSLLFCKMGRTGPTHLKGCFKGQRWQRNVEALCRHTLENVRVREGEPSSHTDSCLLPGREGLPLPSSPRLVETKHSRFSILSPKHNSFLNHMFPLLEESQGFSRST